MRFRSSSADAQNPSEKHEYREGMILQGGNDFCSVHINSGIQKYGLTGVKVTN